MTPGAKLPWMPFFGDDFFGDRNVRVMSREQKMLYVELLWFSWREGGLPAGVDELANIAQMSGPQFRKHWQRIKVCWEPHPDNTTLLVNPRLEELRKEQQKAAEKKSEAAQRAANRRWGKERADA